MVFNKRTLAIPLALLVAISASASAISPRQQCLLDRLESAKPGSTVESIHAACKTQTTGATKNMLERRIRAERQSFDRDYTLTPHRPNYILPITYNSRPNETPFAFEDLADSIHSEEAQIQFSIKFPLKQRVLNNYNLDLLLAYTNRAWWQVYDGALSKPFRETDYEPELFLRHYGGPSILGKKIAEWDVGLVHQSNGQSLPLSRSWNRVFARSTIELTDSLDADIKAWYRIPEHKNSDQNPDIEEFLGYGEARLVFAPNRNTLTAMYRLGSNKNSYELTWSYPVVEHLRLFAYYYNGYGESLIDFDHRNKRIGLGIALNDFVQGHR